MTTNHQFRNGMARVASAVNVVTTDGPGGRRGFTASAVCPVTDTPPTMLVCINKNNESHDAIIKNRVVGINTLAPQHRFLSETFSGRGDSPDGEARFGFANWETVKTGSPLLQGALVNFDCEVAKIVEYGTHSIIFCSVLYVRTKAALDSMIYFDRTYHAIAGVSPDLAAL